MINSWKASALIVFCWSAVRQDKPSDMGRSISFPIAPLLHYPSLAWLSLPPHPTPLSHSISLILPLFLTSLPPSVSSNNRVSRNTGLLHFCHSSVVPLTPSM